VTTEYELVRVDWVDPWSRGGWVDVEELDDAFGHNLGCSTVGWIVRRSDERLMLASSVQTTGSGDQVGDLFVIPLRCIERITPLL